MKILYGYSNCSDKLYKKITSEKNAAVLRPDQKYHGLLIKGLSANVEQVECISGLPVNASVTDRKVVREQDETDGNIHYHYVTTLNVPVLRQIMIFCGSFWSVIKAGRKDTYAVCDCLNIANAYGMTLACRLKNIPVVTIVTDLPDMQRKGGFMKRLNNALFNKVDGFVILTEQMNERINRKAKPYIVSEGHVDAGLGSVPLSEKYETKNGKKVVVYAGSLLKLYGVQNLVEGFIKAKIPDSELWIYGDGDYREELEKICGENDSIKYKGVRDNGEIVEAETRAALLVNPRPSAPEYTKYSFPSKNMEYMVSGTPVLTTKLPGMPREYYPYVYLLEDETSSGVAEALENIFSEEYKTRTEKGISARNFVILNKSNVIQAKKIAGFMKKELYHA